MRHVHIFYYASIFLHQCSLHLVIRLCGSNEQSLPISLFRRKMSIYTALKCFQPTHPSVNFENPLICYTPGSNCNKQVVSTRPSFDPQLGSTAFSFELFLCSPRTISPSVEHEWLVGHRDPDLQQGMFYMPFLLAKKVCKSKVSLMYFVLCRQLKVLSALSKQCPKQDQKGEMQSWNKEQKGLFSRWWLLSSFLNTSQPVLPNGYVGNWSNLSQAAAALGFRPDPFLNGPPWIM